MVRPRGITYKVYECECSHLQLVHHASERSGADGHGGCAVEGCNCTKFRWTPRCDIIFTKSSIEKFQPASYMFAVIPNQGHIQVQETDLYNFHRVMRQR